MEAQPFIFVLMTDMAARCHCHSHVDGSQNRRHFTFDVLHSKRHSNVDFTYKVLQKDTQVSL